MSKRTEVRELAYLLRAEREGTGRSARIGCVPELRLQRLQALVGALSLNGPGVGVDVVRLRSAPQLAALRTGALRLGVVHGSAHAGIETEPLFEGESLAALLPLHHPASGRSQLGPDDFVAETLLRLPRWADPALYDELTAAIESAGYRFRRTRDVGGADVADLLFAVASGSGVALAPLSTLAAGGEHGTIVTAVALEPAPVMPRTALAWPSTAPPGEAAELRALARRLRREGG
jgi:hypothetical protein